MGHKTPIKERKEAQKNINAAKLCGILFFKKTKFFS